MKTLFSFSTLRENDVCRFFANATIIQYDEDFTTRVIEVELTAGTLTYRFENGLCSFCCFYFHDEDDENKILIFDIERIPKKIKMNLSKLWKRYISK